MLLKLMAYGSSGDEFFIFLIAIGLLVFNIVTNKVGNWLVHWYRRRRRHHEDTGTNPLH